ncbi:hypothetical protein Y032_0479g2223 [Ancylostoma ceylanicum]|uniref:Uncharacterized protein n=1 Tax=Ancylostoma ceylanicum TaxID=53326 RepID=A0A016WX46_9BILA|nr:hypothetical protein Y032_0479g2223 [Ancylostoma ceylanicum]
MMFQKPRELPHNLYTSTYENGIACYKNSESAIRILIHTRKQNFSKTCYTKAAPAEILNLGLWQKQVSLSRSRRDFNVTTRQLTLLRWVVWRSGFAQSIPFTRFRGGTHAHLTAEPSSAPSTHGKGRFHFLHFSCLSRSFIPAYDFTVLEYPETGGDLQCKDFRGCQENVPEDFLDICIWMLTNVEHFRLRLSSEKRQRDLESITARSD